MSHLRTIVLVGAGHAHLHIAARAQALTRRGARVVLIDPGDFWYSGMATGMLGGMYGPAEDRVDPRALIRAHGGRFIRGRVESVEAGARRLSLAGGGGLAYDYVSINVGSRVEVEALPGAAGDPSVWPVKPISNLWRLRVHLEEVFGAGSAPRVAVVGGGPTGCEVAANLRALAAHHKREMPVVVATRGERLIEAAPAGAAGALLRKLTRLGVDVRTSTSIARRDGGSLILEDGGRIAADIVVLATGLVSAPLVHRTGLPTRGGQGLRVDAQLRSIADPHVFAGGDCAAMEGFDLPKLGVFGVRQAGCILTNLVASLEGTPLARYRPQRRYLAILNLGDGTALSTWGPLWSMGRSSMWLKDRIDRRFLESFRCDPRA